MSKRYIKNPPVTEAQEFKAGAENASPIIDWVLDNGGTAVWREATEDQPEHIRLNTVWGSKQAIPGDFIVKESDNSFSIWAPSDFNGTFSEITEF
jgi:hypothetical protein